MRVAQLACVVHCPVHPSIHPSGGAGVACALRMHAQENWLGVYSEERKCCVVGREEERESCIALCTTTKCRSERGKMECIWEGEKTVVTTAGSQASE